MDTHFGFSQVAEGDKARRVAGVFSSVARKYDLMNDLMSGGLHRLWKRFTVELAAVRRGQRVLDVAGGTGDLASAFARRVGPDGQVWLTDINSAMLAQGRDRLLDQGQVLPLAQCDAERLPFPNDWFDCITVAFGLRNMTVSGSRWHRPMISTRSRCCLGSGPRSSMTRQATVTSPSRSACIRTRKLSSG